MTRHLTYSALLFCLLASAHSLSAAEEADLILHHGKIATVDANFVIREALAVKDGKLLVVGTNDEALRHQGPKTELVDLQGRLVLPGLIDSHVHPVMAAMHEFDHPIPDMESIADVLAYIKSRAAVVPEGDWIAVRQVFITRLRERRYPTKAELDEVCPRHPVVFSTGPDASVNSLALKLSGIDKDFVPTGAGKIEKDPATGEPTGILRSASNYLKIKSKSAAATPQQRRQRLKQLFADYNSVGLTGVIDRNASEGNLADYATLLADGELPLRIAASHAVDNKGPVESIQKKIAEVARHRLRSPSPWLRVVGIKMFLDGGMLTGSAYMREPWGVSTIYSIDDPAYRGMLYMPAEVLTPVVRTAVENGLQFTAHSVGDGAVQALIDAYEMVNRDTPVAPTRPCVTHGNFSSRQAIDQAARLGVVFDIQPAWLYLDAPTLLAQFGSDRLRYFQPLKSMFVAGVTVGGGSDHMQKIGSLRSINPYNPFLGMWVTVARRAKAGGEPLHPEESLSRQQAVRMYTINNARLMFLEDQVGSLEAGKQADFVILDRDLLTCPVDDMRDAQAVGTYVAGKKVYPQ